jgi:hypothetical protein
MITALVQFRFPQPLSKEKARELYTASARRYQGVPGLIRKYYLLTQDGSTGGGVYLWESREAAERLYNAEWKKTLQDRYGAAPSITYFDSPVVVDNAVGEVVTEG